MQSGEGVKAQGWDLMALHWGKMGREGLGRNTIPKYL